MTVEQWLGENNKIGIDIWKSKYQRNNETFEEWLDRVSGGDEQLKRLIREKKFLPGGRILSNRGIHDSKVTYSNCYVISPPEDNLESIYDCCKNLARTYSYGGGCGIDISKLAPRGAKINNQAKTTSGAVSFMETFSGVTGQIGQNGRRGALMISIDCHHPDLLEFIDIKAKPDSITKANISIRITDDFMEAVMDDADWVMSYVRPETGETVIKTEKATYIWDKICRNNWDWAEPGILFWDRIRDYNLLSNNPEFEYAGTNPCAEEPLPAGGSCLLGSLNLAAFVTSDGTFNWDEFEDAIDIAVYALNDILDEGLPLHPLSEQQESVRNWRQIGLGIMGLADMLIKMGVTYGSEDSFDICNDIGDFMANQAIHASAEYSTLKGSYPKFNKELVKKTCFYCNNTRTNAIDIYGGLCNSQLLTIAPTGTLSTMLGISGGIEPIFANSYTRKTESIKDHDEYYKIYTPIVQEYMTEHDITDEKDLPAYFVTANDISYENRITMQSVWQEHIDASISSTINLPESATVEDVKDIYMKAWQYDLKGVTIFRAGCQRTGILVNDTKSNEKMDGYKATIGELDPSYMTAGVIKPIIRQCSDNLIGKKRKLQTGCGSLHCTAWFDPETGDLMEVYLNKGSTGGCNNFMIGLSRMISLTARAGVSIDDICDQLDSTGVCPSYATRTAVNHDTSKGACCPMAVGKALREMYNEINLDTSQLSKLHYEYQDKTVLAKRDEDGKFNLTNEGKEYFGYSKCPKCGEMTFVAHGGCGECKSCGYSPC